MKKALIALSVIGIASSGLAVAYAREKTPEPEVRTVGEPKNCVQLRSIQSTRIIDNSTIDFKMNGGKTYRNSLPYSCPSLKLEDSFSYRTSLNQLCNVDIIRVLRNQGGQLQEGAGCGLGKFQQIEKVTSAS